MKALIVTICLRLWADNSSGGQARFTFTPPVTDSLPGVVTESTGVT